MTSVLGHWERRADDLARRAEPLTGVAGWLRADVAVGRGLVLAECIRLGRPTVLDIGCGPGTVLEGLLRSGAAGSACGVDLSPRMMMAARARLAGLPVELHVANFAAPSFRPPPSDLVYALGVLDYVPSPVPFLEKARAVCRRTLVFDAPDASVWTALRRLRHRDVRIHSYRREALAALCRSAGLKRFELVRARGTTFVVSRLEP
ncbi:MAG TPA: class I SAM-dependent methyltransferase [Anaeromyxobacter sp.]|jgi:SAM-dependent methyltransferase|nr:class I SAM-dependent methyltransferase [Anaeromyxobacter sp.]